MELCVNLDIGSCITSSALSNYKKSVRKTQSYITRATLKHALLLVTCTVAFTLKPRGKMSGRQNSWSRYHKKFIMNIKICYPMLA